MINALAPLGATHTIVLVLAYGELPVPVEGIIAETTRPVTVTVTLKPKEDGENRTLQFTGPACDVEKELAEKLPLAVAKITAHLASLDELDAQLEEEKKKKQAENKAELEKKPAPAAKPDKSVVKALARKDDKTVTKKPTPAPAPKTAASVAATLEKVKAAAKKASDSKTSEPEADPKSTLAELAGMLPLGETPPAPTEEISL